MGSQNNSESTSEESETNRVSTFRKRRLSLPLIQLQAPIEAEESEDENDDDSSHHFTKLGGNELAGGTVEEKAHSFRVRRLSLTTTKAIDTQNSKEDETSRKKKRDDVSPSNSRAHKRQRKGSEASDKSIRSSSERRVTKTLHAGELLTSYESPPSPAVHSDNVLYTKQPLPPLLALTPIPFLPPEEGTGLEGTKISPKRPQWSRRHTISAEDEHKLPFPLDIVGTYSCHGVEPCYDTIQDEDVLEEDEEEEDEEDETDWFPSGGGKPVAVVMTKPTLCKRNNEFGWGDDEAEEIAVNTTPSNGTYGRPSMAAKINQDRGGVAYPYAGNHRTALFAVYDGHGQGGELVSQFSLHEVQRRLEKHSQFGIDNGQALKDTFLAVDEALKQEPVIEPWYSGTTACVALLAQNVLTLANAGDSRTVMARKKSDGNGWDAIDLTVDQNPDEPAEMERILSLGGHVSPSPGPGLSARVWLDPEFTQVGLAMARSIGDHAVNDVGVIAEPVISKYEINKDDEFIILATDGVWEFMQSEDAVRIVGENINRGATKACQALIEHAAAKWHDEEGEYRDDITAIVAQVQQLWKDSPKQNANQTSNS